jgi:hypothetical protein
MRRPREAGVKVRPGRSAGQAARPSNGYEWGAPISDVPLDMPVRPFSRGPDVDRPFRIKTMPGT